MPAAAWPVDLRGVTESIVTTRGPNDRWNVAALGLHAPAGPGDPVTARTWGQTRTRRNFLARGAGYVQFSRDAEDFARAALTVYEVDEPVLASADAWVEVEVAECERGTAADTGWIDWALDPIDAAVTERTVPTTNRGYSAVVEATIAASRLDVEGYDREPLESRLAYFADVIETCGGPAEQRALRILRDEADW